MEEVIINKAAKDNDDITIVEEVVNDASNKDKISLNIFGKKGRRSKEKVRHDSGGSSDVSLDWKDDPEDLDFDPTFNDKDSKTVVEPEKVDKKQRSIKDAFSFMMQKKAKTNDTSNLESSDSTLTGDKSPTESDQKSITERDEKSANEIVEESSNENYEKSSSDDKCAIEINDKSSTEVENTVKDTKVFEKKDDVITATVAVKDTIENMDSGMDKNESNVTEKDDENKTNEIKAEVVNTLTPQVKVSDFYHFLGFN